ncbi:hypothetical protein [Moraxella marmotae]|uniref:hypothetical protein n=1 Tax=Moraxella marmotae TaxID=3344520 RepID=UPI0035F35DD1
MKSWQQFACLFAVGMALTTADATAKPHNDKLPTDVLPAAAFDGYWAMPKGSALDDDTSTVVSFRRSDNGLIIGENISFRCLPNGKYQRLDTEINVLSPVQDRLAVTDMATKETYAYLRVVALVPKKAMMLNQSFDGELAQLFPEGLNFTYRYTQTVTPWCDVDDMGK